MIIKTCDENKIFLNYYLNKIITVKYEQSFIISIINYSDSKITSFLIFLKIAKTVIKFRLIYIFKNKMFLYLNSLYLLKEYFKIYLFVMTKNNFMSDYKLDYIFYYFIKLKQLFEFMKDHDFVFSN